MISRACCWPLQEKRKWAHSLLIELEGFTDVAEVGVAEAGADGAGLVVRDVLQGARVSDACKRPFDWT